MTRRCRMCGRRLTAPAPDGIGPVCARKLHNRPAARPGNTQPALEDTVITETATLSPASQRLLREIARHDKRGGAVAKYLSRGRYHLGGGPAFNRNSFFPLYENQLVTGWDDEDGGPIRLTDAGAKLAAELDARLAEKKPRPKPSVHGATARRLLREIAKHDEPVLIHSDGRRRVWRLGAHDGYSASVDTWVALQKAGLVRIDYGFAGGRRVTATDAGRQHLA